MTVEKLVPQTLAFYNGRGLITRPVVRVVAYPPNQHPQGCPLIQDCTALEITGEGGHTRWQGCERAYIGADLRMHAVFEAKEDGTIRDEVIHKQWETVQS